MAREPFLESLERSERFDFAAGVLRSTPQLTPAGVWAVFAPVARAVERSASEVARLGVEVIPSASLREWSELMRQFRVVTLIAHSRWPAVSASDIVNPERVQFRLEEKGDGLMRALAEQWQRTSRSSGADAGADPVSLARFLGEICDSAHRWYARPSGQPAAAAQSLGARLRLTRPRLEELFGPDIRPGRAIEFRDGLQTCADVVETIPREWAGFLDLTVCNSAVLGAAIKSRRSRLVVAVNQGLAGIAARTVLYQAVVQSLHRRPAPYAEAQERVRIAVLEEGGLS